MMCFSVMFTLIEAGVVMVKAELWFFFGNWNVCQEWMYAQLVPDLHMPARWPDTVVIVCR